jgi:predicted aldo/keto reductase-like oxidoreductase
MSVKGSICFALFRTPKGEIKMDRRKFLKTVAATGIGAFASLHFNEEGFPEKPEDMKIIAKRPFGNTDEELSLIGLGGVVVIKMQQSDVNNLVHESIDRGVNYVDVAPTYGNGEAEELLGPALNGYRDKIFLACKTTKRKKEEAAAELHQSLERLKTDHFDLYQFHAISTMEDVETIFGKGGAVEAFEEARKQGLIRYIGFSAHSVKAALAAMDRFDFDSILFPINFALYHRENFGPQVVEKAKDKDVARLAIKAMSNSQWPPNAADREKFPNCWYQPVSDPVAASMALRFTLSQPITAAVPPGDANLFRMAMDIASQFTPINDEEEEELKKIAQSQKQESLFKLDV